MIHVTALMDDLASDAPFIGEHGLSYLVESTAGLFLFDCGQSANTWVNARLLERDIYNIDAVVLSHSHYDHAGGYPSLVRAVNGGSLLYTGPGFWEEKYSFDGVTHSSRSAGFDASLLTENGITHKTVSDVSEIAPGIWLVGAFPRVHAFETIPARYVRKTDSGYVPDDFSDEICMAIDVGGRLAVLVGCAHPGILNMVKRVTDALNLPVHAIFGGTHLLEADDARIDATLKALRDMGVALFGLGHCSGPGVETAIARTPGLQGRHLGAGDFIVL